MTLVYRTTLGLLLSEADLLRRISEDPSLALRILEKMSNRIRDLDNKLVRLRMQIES